MASTRDRWDEVYGRLAVDRVSWYRPHLEQSIALIEDVCPDRGAAIIDVGGGASTLVDDLLARGFTNLTVLDISAKALDAARGRLGERAASVRWLTGDVTRVPFATGAYDLWHDRAVFHFLRDEADRRRYVAAVRSALKPGGHVIIATFGPDGPERCSGLEVVRYSPEALHAEFGGDFEPVRSTREVHQTPAGKDQPFTTCLFRLSAAV
jgi:SAM-dependent methyltransferase